MIPWSQASRIPWLLWIPVAFSICRSNRQREKCKIHHQPKDHLGSVRACSFPRDGPQDRLWSVQSILERQKRRRTKYFSFQSFCSSLKLPLSSAATRTARRRKKKRRKRVFMVNGNEKKWMESWTFNVAIHVVNLLLSLQEQKFP